MDQRSARNSKAIEEIGYYRPLESDDEKALKIDGDRARYWLGVGAQPTETVLGLLRRAGILESKKSA